MQEIERKRFGNFSYLHRPGEGEGQVTVHFAHATGFNAETYRELFQMLNPSLDLYAMDARGHGLSEAPANPKLLRSWSQYRRDLRRFVETLRAPIVLAGHSMGATVSMELAAEAPDLVGGLVLIDPVITPPRHIPVLAVARSFGIEERFIPIAQMAARRRMEFPSKEAAVDNYVGKGPFRTWPRSWIEAYVDGGTVATSDGQVRLSCDRTWESKTFTKVTLNPYPAIERIRCPITLIARDHAGPPFSLASRDAFMEHRPETRLLILEEASHFMTMERPEISRDEIERMAAQVRSELG